MMKKAMFVTAAALGVTAFLMAQDISKFNGTWKAESGQTRKLTVKGGVIWMEEMNVGKGGAPGKMIRRQYATNGELVTPGSTPEEQEYWGVWAGAKVKGRTEGAKVIVDTESVSFGNWHDEWEMAPDGKSYAALRVSTGGNFAGKGGPGGGKGPGGPGGGAPPAAGPGGGGPGGGKGKAAPTPEVFHRVE
jgi:hypothetical protein